MAGNPPADGSGDGSTRKSKKRGAENDSEGQGATQKSKRRSWNPFASTEAKFDPEIDEGSATPSPPPPTAEERAEHQRRMAKAIDEAAGLVRTKELVDIVATEPFNLDIKPTDVAWTKKREQVLTLLQDKKNSVLKVLKELGIEDGSFQALQLLPPKSEDLALELQRENTELYKKAIRPGGPFENIKDNLVTKLAMLHFGLPIEPLTYNNVKYCEEDINDPPDDEQEGPRVQRILYSEKALEFLDCYHERSFGFPMLRRPKVIPQKILQPVGETPTPLGYTAVRQGPSHHHGIREPLQPTGDLVSMRGGGGAWSNRFLYSRYGASIKLDAMDNEVSADDFRLAALKALDLNPDSAWAIVVDQFDNSERFKTTAIKPFVRSFVVRPSDFDEIYDSYLKAKISNRLENSILSVDYYHLRKNGERNADPFVIPPRNRNGRDTLDLTKLPKLRPQNSKDATDEPTLPSTPRTSSKQSTRDLCAYPGGTSQPFEDNAESFTNAVIKLVPPEGARAMSVSLYSRQLDNTTQEIGKPLDHTILFPLTSNSRQYLDIRRRVFQETGWTVVVHQTTTAPAGFWPLSSGRPNSAQIKRPRFLIPKPALASAPLFLGKRGVQTMPTSSDFGKQALKLLGIDPQSHWHFAVDFYSNQLHRVDGGSHALDFSHTVKVRKASLEKQYVKDIQPRLFRGEADWAVVVRHSTEDAASSFTPFEVLPDVPIPTPPAPPLAHMPHVNCPPPSGSKPSKRRIVSTGPSSIYGYGGQVEVEKNVRSFKEGALALLGLSNVEGWTFTVDLHDTSPPKSIDVSAATIADRFEKFIKRVPGDPETYPWPVFVRKCAKVSPKELTPPDDLRHYVILRRPSGESYWKLPTPLDDRYGMNQLQDAFFAAMLVHYPLGTSRPPQNVDFNTDLGYGGLEITQEFWDTVTKQFHDHPDKAFAVCTGLPPPSTDLTYGMGIRLAGTHRSGTFRPGDFTGLAKALRELSQVVLFEKAQNQTSSPPTSFRAWFTAEDRENNVDSCIFYYDDNNPHASKDISLADSLRAWFQSLSIDKSTNCIWFRPEWKQFTVIDNSTSDLRDMEVDHTNQTWDATADSSLDSFRDMLAVLFDDDDYEFTENFEITIPQANQRFVINCHTTEESWRKHVFDYFHDNTLIVSRSDGIMCMTDSSEPWGVLDMPSPRKPAAIAPHKPLPVPPKPTPVDRGHHYDHHDNNGNHHGNGLHLGIGNGNRNNNGGAPPPVVQPPHESRRIPGAKPPIFRTTEVPKFDEWMLNHTAQNTLQQRSWTQDQSVIEPGHAPAAPLYGDNLELGITAGSSMPTVFTQHLTPTDIMQLRKENRKLLNHALEREIGCPICNMTFKAYDNDAKAAHYKGHIDQLNSVSTCPICNETWALFTFDQKRNHLFADFAKRESKDIAQFWEDTRCPICNLDLRGKSSEDVTTHIATHVPGALKFCDRCGFDVIACTPAERAHHERACTRHTPIREPEAPDPILCQSCGRERRLASGKTKKHNVCGNGQYCIRCGLNLSLLDVQEQNEHSKRCRVPGGAAGKYCKRCGKKLEGLSALGLASHNNACYRREPTSVAADNNPWNRLSEAVEAQRLKNATELADLRARQTELKAQETAILSREQAVLKREMERNKIDNLFQDFQDLARDHLCQTNLINHSRQDIVDHFRKVHRKDTFGSIIDGNQDMHVHGIASSTGMCPFPGCYENLDVLSKESLRRHLRQHADETLAHYHHHGEKVNNLPACHSAALNASLAEFKRRLPDFREAHAILQNLVDVSGAAGTQHRLPRPPAPKTSAEKEKEEKEHREIAQLENRLGIKLAKEEYDLKHATEGIQKQRSEMFQLRAELVDAEDADPVVEGAPVPDAVIVARTKVDQAEAALSKAENDEAQRSARVADHIDQQQAALAVRKRGSGYVPDPVNFDHPGELQGGGGGGSSGGGERGEGGGDGGGGDNPSGGDPSSGEDADQTGFLPSPTRPSFKKLPTPRRARSVKGRAPTTGSKRKKASMDDSEDTMPGGFSNLVRSPSKRETKKMRMAGERMRSHEMMRRRIMMAEEPEGEEISEFAAGEGVLSGVPRRATRGMSSTPGAAPRKVGRPRKIVQKDVEDDGFEDVEEEDE